MQLREIHIDGFGVLRDKHITGISSGANVLYGPNEFGKSTLLEFVRRMLFGFRGANPYPALSGGTYGGKLVCELSSGNVITISRKEGRSGGIVKIIADSAELSGQEELGRILGPITQKFYENVYAIGLDELQTIKTLEEDEIESHIYGAGLGLDNTSLKEIKDTFSRQSDAVFKPGGSAQEMPILHRAIREKEKAIAEKKKLLADYDGLIEQYNKIQYTIESLSQEILKQAVNQRRLQAQVKLFPTYIALKESEARLTAIPETPLFHEDAIQTLGVLETTCSSLDKQTRGSADDLAELLKERDLLAYDERIIGVEPSVISLQKKSEQFRSASTDIVSVKTQRTGLADGVRAQIDRLGHGWTEDKVRGFNFDLSQEDRCRSAKKDIDEAERNVEGIMSKFEAHRESKATESGRASSLPTFVKVPGYASAILGSVGIVLGVFLSQPFLSVFSAFLLIVGLMAIAGSRKVVKNPLPDALEKKYAGDLSVAESVYAEVLGKWEAQLRDFGLEESLSPDGAVDAVRTIRDLQSDLASMRQLDSRIEFMQNAIQEVNSLLGQVALGVGKAKVTEDTIASIELLNLELGTAKGLKGKKEALEQRITELTDKVKRGEDELRGARDALGQYISTFGAKDESEFRSKHHMFQTREDLKKSIDASKTVIQSAVGTGDEYDDFVASLSSTNPIAIATFLEAAESRLRDLNRERDQNNQTVGELRIRIKDLSSEDLVAEQTELETKRQQLRDISAKWVRSQVALFVLGKAISKYENTRQPEVIKAASEVLARITNQAYSMIVKPADMTATKPAELAAQDPSMNRRGIAQMSRGTREQVYMSMRLGLIAVYEAGSEPMPIVVDDILANFDDARGQEAIRALIEFSGSRQVIALTCHSNTLNLFRSLGAKEISLA
jgi:uncharacterized protein YhaN